MKQMRYIGPLKELADETALVRPKQKGSENKCLAQFDGDRSDLASVSPVGVLHPITKVQLCQGWHEFDRADFADIERPDDPCDFMLPPANTKGDANASRKG